MQSLCCIADTLAVTVSLKLSPQWYCQLADGNGNDDTDDNCKSIYGNDDTDDNCKIIYGNDDTDDISKVFMAMAIRAR